MRAPTEILGIRYFLLGVIFTRTDTRVESSHQGPPQNKNKSFSFHFQTARAFGPGLLILLYVLPAPLGRTTTYYHILLRGFRLLVPSRPGLISYRIRVQYPLYPVYNRWLSHFDLKFMQEAVSLNIVPLTNIANTIKEKLSLCHTWSGCSSADLTADINL